MEEGLYDRQKTLELNIPEAATVIGVGGVGSWLALDLAMVGVKRLVLYDDDNVELTNLNRTPFKLSQVGRPKVFSIMELIMERRSDVEVQAICKRFVLKNLKTSPLPIFDMRDSLNGDGINWKDSDVKPAINGGYDGTQICIFTDTDNNAWESDSPQIGYTITPSYIVPPQLLASLILHYTLMEEKPKVRFTFNVDEIISILAWAGEKRLKGDEEWKK